RELQRVGWRREALAGPAGLVAEVAPPAERGLARRLIPAQRRVPRHPHDHRVVLVERTVDARIEGEPERDRRALRLAARTGEITEREARLRSLIGPPGERHPGAVAIRPARLPTDRPGPPGVVSRRRV